MGRTMENVISNTVETLKTFELLGFTILPETPV